VTCHFRGTDTHGLKAFRREALLETARRCMLDRDVFASEFVIRAHREGKRVLEIPFAVREKRPPSIRLSSASPTSSRAWPSWPSRSARTPKND
jgi:hypothetical protein